MNVSKAMELIVASYVKVRDSAVWPARLQNLVNAGPAVGSLGE